jgi:hypothetical protein
MTAGPLLPERVRFELTVGYKPTVVFKTTTLNRSDTSPSCGCCAGVTNPTAHSVYISFEINEAGKRAHLVVHCVPQAGTSGAFRSCLRRNKCEPDPKQLSGVRFAKIACIYI